MKKIVSLVLAVVLLATMLTAMAIPAFAKENAGGNGNPSNPVTYGTSMQDMGKGSALSEGSLAIIVGVTAAVVFGLGGFFIGKAVGKKKKTAVASGENTDEE